MTPEQAINILYKATERIMNASRSDYRAVDQALQVLAPKKVEPKPEKEVEKK